MTTQFFEIGDASYGMSRGVSGELLITASDPEQPGRVVNIVASQSPVAGYGFGIGPVFTMPVNSTELN